MAITQEALQKAHDDAYWTATPVEGFKHTSLRKYRHEAKALIAGRPGLTQEEQEKNLTDTIEVLTEAVAYSQGRDFAAHQAAKAAAREAYEATLAQYHAENPFDVEDFEEEDSEV